MEVSPPICRLFGSPRLSPTPSRRAFRSLLVVFAGRARAHGWPRKVSRQEGRVEFVEACQPKRPIRPAGQAKKAVNKRRFAAG